MKKRDDHKDVHKDKWLNVDRGQLEQLTLDVREYTSYLDLSDISNDLEENFNGKKKLKRHILAGR